MADPLSLFRQYNINKREIIERDNQIILGEFSWPKNVKTNCYKGSPKSAKGSVKEYYTLECLLYFLKNLHLFHPDYCKQVAAANIMAVWRPDRKKLLAYLNGETDTYALIDKSVPLPIPTLIKQKPDLETGESAVKKPRIEENPVQKLKKEMAVSSEPNETLVKVENIELPVKKPRIEEHPLLKVKEELAVSSNPNETLVKVENIKQKL